MAKKPLSTVDLTLQVLREIRDEVRATNVRLESLERSTNDRFGEVTAGLADLRKAQVESEMRLATELVALNGVLSDLQRVLKENTFVRLSDLERRVADVERKVS